MTVGKNQKVLFVLLFLGECNTVTLNEPGNKTLTDFAIGFIVWSSAEGLSCNSCGEECTDACGTRFFRQISNIRKVFDLCASHFFSPVV